MADTSVLRARQLLTPAIETTLVESNLIQANSEVHLELQG